MRRVMPVQRFLPLLELRGKFSAAGGVDAEGAGLLLMTGWGTCTGMG